MEDYSYAWEKYYNALRFLVGPGDQRERVEHAFVHSLIRLLDQDVPPQFLVEHKALVDDASSVSAQGDEGSIAATLSSLDDSAVDKLAERIVDLYDSICRLRAPG